jgi:putative transposase
MLHKYPHFNPNKYQLDVKIATVRNGFHCKFNINYHLVWIPKYRKTVLEGQVKDELRNILTDECKELELEMLALEIMPDHLHLFVGAKPTHTYLILSSNNSKVFHPSNFENNSLSWYILVM